MGSAARLSSIAAGRLTHVKRAPLLWPTQRRRRSTRWLYASHALNASLALGRRDRGSDDGLRRRHRSLILHGCKRLRFIGGRRPSLVNDLRQATQRLLLPCGRRVQLSIAALVVVIVVIVVVVIVVVIVVVVIVVVVVVVVVGIAATLLFTVSFVVIPALLLRLRPRRLHPSPLAARPSSSSDPCSIPVLRVVLRLCPVVILHGRHLLGACSRRLRLRLLHQW